MNLQELQALNKPKKSLKTRYKELVRCILAMKQAKDGKIVYPGKGLTGREIRARVLNRSYLPGVNGLAYSEEKGVAEVLSMSRIDLMRSRVNEQPKIDKMKADLQKKAEEARMKKVEGDIVKRVKEQNNG